MEFKEGEIYVDINTNNVHIYNESFINGKVFNQRVLCLGSNMDNNVGIITIGKDLRLIKDALRPWQQSDEPTAYDEEKWGKIQIGKVYRAKLYSDELDEYFFYKILPICTSGEFILAAKFSEFSRKIEIGTEEFHLDYEFKNIITRPAFPHEIQGLKMPKLEGYVDNDTTMK